jgi:hypothetical protein
MLSAEYRCQDANNRNSFDSMQVTVTSMSRPSSSGGSSYGDSGSSYGDSGSSYGTHSSCKFYVFFLLIFNHISYTLPNL